MDLSIMSILFQGDFNEDWQGNKFNKYSRQQFNHNANILTIEYSGHLRTKKTEIDLNSEGFVFQIIFLQFFI